MSAPAGDPGGTGSTPESTPPAQQTRTPPVQPAGQAASTTTDPLADHDDGLFDVKDGDPAWIKRLRTQGANYRTRARDVTAERDDWKGKYEKLAAERETEQRTAIEQRRTDIAKKHGLWDDAANSGKGGLLPGIDLGTGSAEDMEKTAAAIVAKFRGTPAGGSTKRPVTLTGTTSGTSDLDRPGAGKAASALRELMRNRGGGTSE